MSDLGDRALGSTVDLKFTTAVNGVPTTLSGSPVISVYQGGSTTPITSGVTLTVDYHSTTGLNDVSIVATTGNTFAAGNDYQVVITTGTLGGVSMVGFVVGDFSLNLGNVGAVAGNATAATNLSQSTQAIGRGTATTGGSTTSIVTSAFSPSGAVANQFAGRVIIFDAGTTTTALRGQATTISASSNAASPTFTVTALTTAPVSGDTFSVI